ncbi:MAG: hypothetical protein ICV69_13455 [Thermoleophilaceae bacterium]|nr:hypothetical protein [Thermoleophilaceae bacterium]
MTATVLAAGAAVAGCGEDDFANKPRPPVPVQLTGVIQDDAVTVSPSRIGAGPIAITISNQTEHDTIVTLEGSSIRTRVGPVAPLDTATLQKTLDPGRYEVRAGSKVALPREIRPAELEIGRKRPSSSNVLLLP